MQVVVLGAGIIGISTAWHLLQKGHQVTVVDRSADALKRLASQFGTSISTVFSTRSAIEELVRRADLLIGTVLVPGAAAPKLITRKKRQRQTYRRTIGHRQDLMEVTITSINTDGKAPAKKAAPAKKRTPHAAFMKAMTPRAALAAIVGASPLPRTEVTKKVWEYIKKNKLQDAVNKRMINADDKLKALFGKAQASMFELTKMVNKYVK